MIQDILLTICGILLSTSLLPQIIKIIKTKSAKDFSFFTALITSNILSFQAMIFITLELFFSAIMLFITAGAWYIILYYKIKEILK